MDREPKAPPPNTADASLGCVPQEPLLPHQCPATPAWGGLKSEPIEAWGDPMPGPLPSEVSHYTLGFFSQI